MGCILISRTARFLGRHLAGTSLTIGHEAVRIVQLGRRVLDYETSTEVNVSLKNLTALIKKKGPKEFPYHLPLEFITNTTSRSWSEKLM
jgi:hypothetical protein